MAPPAVILPVDIAGTAVQRRVITEELHVTGPKFHVETKYGIARRGIEIIERLFQFRRDARYVGEALRLADDAARIADDHPPLVVVEHRHRIPGAAALGNLLAPVALK